MADSSLQLMDRFEMLGVNLWQAVPDMKQIPADTIVYEQTPAKMAKLQKLADSGLPPDKMTPLFRFIEYDLDDIVDIAVILNEANLLDAEFQGEHSFFETLIARAEKLLSHGTPELYALIAEMKRLNLLSEENLKVVFQQILGCDENVTSSSFAEVTKLLQQNSAVFQDQDGPRKFC